MEISGTVYGIIGIMRGMTHPPLESILGLDFNEHGKTLYYSIFCPFCYTVGVSHFLFMEGFPYRGKMDIIYTKLWDFERVL